MHYDFVIVGCGFAGAATAYHLSRSGLQSILLIDREKVPGYHASGRNASLFLQSVADPMLREMTVACRRAYESLSGRVDFDQHGSLLLGTREALEECRAPDLVETVFREPAEIRDRIPVLADHAFESALETPSDGVMDISALLQFYIEAARERGTEVLLDCRLESVTGDSPFVLSTSKGRIQASTLVNAAGAWAAEIGRLAGATEIPLTPWKRHLFVLDGIPGLARDMPFVWDLAQEFYFRSESGGLLFSICDELPSKSLEPTVDPAITAELAELILRELPRASGGTVRQAWSCFRTKAEDGGFVIGPDPGVDRFFWVAGLGGHGMGTSWEVGRLAAAALATDRPLSASVKPTRFTTV